MNKKLLSSILGVILTLNIGVVANASTFNNPKEAGTISVCSDPDIPLPW